LLRHNPDTPAPGRGYSESAHLRMSDKFAQTDPCCNGNDYKYKPILNDSALVNISETDKAIDFKYGTQLQTYNTHKVTNIPTQEA